MTTLTYIAASLLGIGWLVFIVMVTYSESKYDQREKRSSNPIAEDSFSNPSDTGSPL